MLRPFYKFAISVFIVLFALLVQLKFGSVGAGFENAVLLALVGLAFALSWSELCALVAAAAWVLHAYPGFSAETLLIVILPLAVRLAREFFPAVPLVSFLVAEGAGVGIWYFLVDARFLTQFTGLFLGEILSGVFWAALLFLAMRSLSLFHHS